MKERLTFQKAKQIMEKKKTLLFLVNKQEHIALHPKYTGNVKQGVMTLLDSFMSLYQLRLMSDELMSKLNMKGKVKKLPFKSYAVCGLVMDSAVRTNVKEGVTEHEITSAVQFISSDICARSSWWRFDGVPVAYNNVKMNQKHASVISYQPYLHFDITADFIVFKPNVGCSLKGIIQKVEKDHISCLVHGVFNAWFPKQPLLKVVKEPDPVALIGREVEFMVTKLSYNNGVLSLRGDFKKISKKKPALFGAVTTSTPAITKKTPSDDDEDGDGQDDMDMSFCPPLTSTQMETPYLPSSRQRKRKLSKVFEGDSSIDADDIQESAKELNNSEMKHESKVKKKKRKLGKDSSHTSDTQESGIDSMESNSYTKLKKKHKKQEKEREEIKLDTSKINKSQESETDWVNKSTKDKKKKKRRDKEEHSSEKSSSKSKLSSDSIEKEKQSTEVTTNSKHKKKKKSNKLKE